MIIQLTGLLQELPLKLHSCQIVMSVMYASRQSPLKIPLKSLFFRFPDRDPAASFQPAGGEFVILCDSSKIICVRCIDKARAQAAIASGAGDRGSLG